MPILSGDVKLMKSVVMADVPEGGGAPSGQIIADGVSNAIFQDISELDRAGGRVSVMKTFIAVDTADRDTYFGANVIVAEPPQDPRVSVTLFSTRSTFDLRTDAATRIESYLNSGPEWGGYLFENHITGQRVVQLFQRPGAELPNVGQTLVLVVNEGQPSQKTQYIRATKVSTVDRLFYDAATANDYTASVVTVELSDSLRYDFPGSSASRSFSRSPVATKLRDTVVADAGTYVGVVPLTTAAVLGDFTVQGSSIFTQLVPSAQTETPLSDIRTNGLSAALVSTGAPLSQTISTTFSTTQNLFVGGPIYPGSLGVVRSGVTVTDAGGLLMSAGAQVGTVDYDNGILTLLANIWGTAPGAHAVTFEPATVPELISDQIAIRVTLESRSQNYTFTMARPPLPRTLSVSYVAQGRWYVLRDSGAGVLAGVSSDYGVGTVSYTTGSVSVTLGALPDVGSSLIVQSYSDLATVTASNTLLLSDKAYVAFNSDGVQGEEKGSKAITRKTLVVNWSDNGVEKYVNDTTGLGVLSGDGTGTVDYTNGIIRVSPTVMPPSGTVFTAGSKVFVTVPVTPTTPFVAGSPTAPQALTTHTISQG